MGATRCQLAWCLRDYGEGHRDSRRTTTTIVSSRDRFGVCGYPEIINATEAAVQIGDHG